MWNVNAKISGSHSGLDEESSFLGFYGVSTGIQVFVDVSDPLRLPKTSVNYRSTWYGRKVMRLISYNHDCYSFYKSRLSPSK